MNHALPTLPVLQEIKGRLGLLTLNRPQQLHALDMIAIELLDSALEEWANYQQVSAVVIRHAGGRGFCAGGDVRAIWQLRHQHPTEFWPQNLRYIATYFRREYALNHRIKFYPKPIIVLMDGLTMGGGVGLAAHASLRLATENTQWAMPEAAIGFIPDVGSSYILSRLPAPLARLLGLLGWRVDGAGCMTLGLAEGWLPSSQIPPLLDWLALQSIDQWRPGLLQAALADFLATPPPSAAANALPTMAAPMVTDDVWELDAASRDWPSPLQQAWRAQCPLSLAVIAAQLAQARTQTFNECLQTEYRLCLAMLAQPNFYEGVRAALVDKDRQPRWQPASLNEVSAATVDNCFDPAIAHDLPPLLLPEADCG